MPGWIRRQAIHRFKEGVFLTALWRFWRKTALPDTLIYCSRVTIILCVEISPHSINLGSITYA